MTKDEKNKYLTEKLLGEEWRDCCGDGLILALAQEIESLKQQLATIERERDKWKQRVEQLANFNPDWDQLEACQESLREHMQMVKTIERETAEKCVKLLNMYLADQEDEIVKFTIKDAQLHIRKHFKLGGE